MALANRCYVRCDIDCNPLAVQPAKVLVDTNTFSNHYYDFNADYEKKGLKISDTECQDLTTDDYNRTDIDNVNKDFDLSVYKGTDVNCVPVNPSARSYIRRGLQDPNTGKTSYINDTCPPTITFAAPGGGSDVNITDFAIITENRLIIIAEQDGDIYFEPAESTTTDNFIIL